jgi:uncharacterized protein YjbI with pentapeptide repeats
VANEEHLKILKQGAKVWNRWREDCPWITPNLSESRLYDFNLEGADLISTNFDEAAILNCNLSNALLNNAEMFRTMLYKTELIQANLSKSNLVYTVFDYSCLEKAILQDTSILNAKFNDVDFRDTDFSRATMSGNAFINVDLSLAKGLESLNHWGSSTIGIDTLYKSAGEIPESFLRGCGIPDDFITFIPSHFGVQQAIQFYSCFISYSTKDEEFARRLYSRMRDEKLRVWFAPEDIKGGEKLHEQIERAIQLHDRLLIILSEESMRSEWVMTEIRRARKTEVEQKRRKLFPIRLVDFEAIKNWERFDADSGMDIAAEVRSYHIPDFSDWKNHDSFEKGFARLLRDLRAEETRQVENGKW